MKKITTLLVFLVSLSAFSQANKLSDFEGEWVQKDKKYEKDEFTLSVINNSIKIKMTAYGSCPYVFEYNNAKFENGKIFVTRKQYDSGGDVTNSKAVFEINDRILSITDLAQYYCREKTIFFTKKVNPIDEIIGTYKMDDKDYNKHITALIGNYGKYLEITKNGNSIRVIEYDLNGSEKNYIKHKYYKYDKNTNTVSGINYMQDEYDKTEKKYKLSFNNKKIIRNQEWWGFPDNLILNYMRI